MHRDPEDHELTYLLRYGPVQGRRVIDIGCGDGELTHRFAPTARSVTALDPSKLDLREALGQRPAEQSPQVHFAAARGQALPFPTGHFDLAFFTSSF